jgi:hypothetical protein
MGVVACSGRGASLAPHRKKKPMSKGMTEIFREPGILASLMLCRPWPPGSGLAAIAIRDWCVDIRLRLPSYSLCLIAAAGSQVMCCRTGRTGENRSFLRNLASDAVVKMLHAKDL